jgi:predicted outer membrane repeat protein
MAFFSVNGIAFYQATATVTACTISGDFAETGGGAIVNGGTLTVTDSTLSGNSAGLFGGAIFTSGGAPT